MHAGVSHVVSGVESHCMAAFSAMDVARSLCMWSTSGSVQELIIYLFISANDHMYTCTEH